MVSGVKGPDIDAARVLERLLRRPPPGVVGRLAEDDQSGSSRPSRDGVIGLVLDASSEVRKLDKSRLERGRCDSERLIPEKPPSPGKPSEVSLEVPACELDRLPDIASGDDGPATAG